MEVAPALLSVVVPSFDEAMLWMTSTVVGLFCLRPS